MALESGASQYRYSDRLDDDDDGYYEDVRDEENVDGGDWEDAEEGIRGEECWDEDAGGVAPAGKNNHEGNGGGDWDDSGHDGHRGMMTMGIMVDMTKEIADTMMATVVDMMMAMVGIVGMGELPACQRWIVLQS